MDRRNSIKLILAAAIAPAFVAEGLMPVKPTAALMQTAGVDLYGTNEAQVFDIAFLRRLMNDPKVKNIKPFIPNSSQYLFIIHPDMKAELINSAKDDARWLASVKWMDKKCIAEEYITDEATGLLVGKRHLNLLTAANMVGNHNGYIKPIWDSDNE